MNHSISRRSFVAASAASVAGFATSALPALAEEAPATSAETAEAAATDAAAAATDSAIPLDKLGDGATYDDFVAFGEQYLADQPDPEGMSSSDDSGISTYSLRSTSPYWSSDTKGPKTFYNGDGSAFLNQALKVVDVSYWQGDIDWDSVSKSSVDAVILRCGYGIGNEDKKFARNVSECRRLGIKFGVYFFSYAFDSDFAYREGQWFNQIAAKYSFDKDMPIYYDLEAWTWTGFTCPTSPSVYEGIVQNFFSAVTGAGYSFVRIYTGQEYAKNQLNSSYIWPKISWLAHYHSNLYNGYSFSFSTTDYGWQYTDSGYVPGIGNADTSAFTMIPYFYKTGGQAKVTRIGGTDAWDTAVAISRSLFSSSSTAVVARYDDFADSMSATGLTGALEGGSGAPILLTQRDRLTGATLTELKRLGVSKVYLVGGTVAIKPAVESSLKSAGLSVQRVAGTESADTSVACAKVIRQLDSSATSKAIVAYGQNFQDALSISSFAYKYHVPIFLTMPGDSPSARKITSEGLKLLKGDWGSAAVFVPGGTGAVASSSIEDELGASRVTRVYGQTGYDTSSALAKYLVDRGYLSAENVVIASGAPGPMGVDALAGSALAGKKSGPVLLLNGAPKMGATDTTVLFGDGFLQDRHASVKNAWLLGGTAVMPDSTMEQVKNVI